MDGKFEYEGKVELASFDGTPGLTAIVLSGGTTLARELELALKLKRGEQVKVKIVVDRCEG